MPKSIKPRDELDCRRYLYYDKDTGDMKWKPRRSEHFNKNFAWNQAAYLTSNGEYAVKIRGKQFQAARIAWAFTRGVLPKRPVMTIDGDKANIAAHNLTDVPAALRPLQTRFSNVFVGDKGYDARIFRDGRTAWIRGIKDIKHAALVASSNNNARRYIADRLTYDEKTGVFTWKDLGKRTISRTLCGKQAGRTDKEGNMTIKIEGVSYPARRLAWLMAYGEYPDCTVFVADGDVSNLAADNLTLNQPNTSERATEYVGVRSARSSSTYEARFKRNGKTYYLYGFRTAEEAHKARRKAIALI